MPAKSTNCKLQGELIPDTENKGKVEYYKHSSGKIALGITKVFGIRNRTKKSMTYQDTKCYLIKMSKRKDKQNSGLPCQQ